MSGLPCEACQEPMISFQGGTLVDDPNGRVLYSRRRICTNTRCEFYLIDRETLEVAVPLTATPKVVSPYLYNLRRYKLPRRMTPPPEIPSGEP